MCLGGHILLRPKHTYAVTVRHCNVSWTGVWPQAAWNHCPGRASALRFWKPEPATANGECVCVCLCGDFERGADRSSVHHPLTRSLNAALGVTRPLVLLPSRHLYEHATLPHIVGQQTKKKKKFVCVVFLSKFPFLFSPVCLSVHLSLTLNDYSSHDSSSEGSSVPPFTPALLLSLFLSLILSVPTYVSPLLSVSLSFCLSFSLSFSLSCSLYRPNPSHDSSFVCCCLPLSSSLLFFLSFHLSLFSCLFLCLSLSISLFLFHSSFPELCLSFSHRAGDGGHQPQSVSRVLWLAQESKARTDIEQ